MSFTAGERKEQHLSCHLRVEEETKTICIEIPKNATSPPSLYSLSSIVSVYTTSC